MKKLLIVMLVACFACKSEDGPVPDIGLSAVQYDEGNVNRTVGIELALATAYEKPLEIQYRTQDGSAKAGSDFVEVNSSFTIPAGSLTGAANVEFIGDEHLELIESFDLIVVHGGEEIIYTIEIIDEDTYTPEKVADGYITPMEYPSMELVWSDEFNEATVNTNNWTFEIGDGCDKGICGWGNNESQSYTDNEENIRIENDNLIITAVEKVGNYTSARIITQDKQEFQYGRIDIRAKMPEGQGLWPAIWMLGANIDTDPWPVCGEIDIMELVGHLPGTTYGSVHYDAGGYKYTTSSSSVTLPESLQNEYHIYSIVWDRNEIRWLLDYEQFKFVNKDSIGEDYPFNDPFFFIMNIAVEGNWPGKVDETTTFPQTMTVDYIRLFK